MGVETFPRATSKLNSPAFPSILTRRNTKGTPLMKSTDEHTPLEKGIESDAVIVAMSGGVDSSVSALLLHEQGYKAVGVSMQVWDYRKNGGCDSKATCCSPDDFTDARLVAKRIGIPYYVFDLEEIFREQVIERFVKTYEDGKTPNPCVDCNNKVKFLELRKRAKSFGCKQLATGHFARIEKDGEKYKVFRGRDQSKDQSYFLYGLKHSELPETLFPVGEMTKDEVRERAREAGLPTASKPESQDICFVSGSARDFVARIGKGKRPGNFTRRNGEIIGKHDGIHGFTVGQRRGLGLGGEAEPLYVIEICANTNTVIVGERHELEREDFVIENLSFVSKELENDFHQEDQTFERECFVQVRHRHNGVRARLRRSAVGQITATFVEEWTSISPGQAAVFYGLDNEELLGGGRII